MPADAVLPIRRLTLYKHGVCFVQRQGIISGEEVRLVFRAAEVNDALKSLLAVDRNGGQILGIHYQTPTDHEALLADSPIVLAPDHSVLDLLRGLRGAPVHLTVDHGSDTEQVQGRLLGIETVNDTAPLADWLVGLLTESGSVRLLPLQSICAVQSDDERANGDLDFFLDTSRTEDTHRTVSVQLQPGEHDLFLSYLLPSPVWRVSYRLIAEAAITTDEVASRQPATSGQLLLQGWGLFDNRLEEDLQDVHVTLVAGQPISFVYDLASSRIPTRPFVAEQGRVAAAPVEFRAALGGATSSATFMREREDSGDEVLSPGRMPKFYSPPMASSAPMPHSRPYDVDSLANSVTGAVGNDQGELFAYTVAAPVTAKRGASALVPIFNQQLPYRRELLFNAEKLPGHPVAAMRFTNTTGLVLERGPVTVLEDGEYRGEAIVPFTKESGEVYLAFAVELGIAVTRTTHDRRETAAISIRGAMLSIKRATITSTTYRLENTLADTRMVTVEHRLSPNTELVDTEQPGEHTAEHYRWSISCPGRQATTFEVQERRYTWSEEQLLDRSYTELHTYLRRNWLDAATLARIKAMLDAKQAVTRNDREEQGLETERKSIYGREEQLRENMGALRDSEEEGSLRRSMVAQLGAAESRIAAIEARIAELAVENERYQETIDAELRTLNVD